MPPQQGDGLLDVFDGSLNFGTHVDSPGADIGSAAWFVKFAQ
jgi:hypothetical protein